jgi:hypothetical protein
MLTDEAGAREREDAPRCPQGECEVKQRHDLTNLIRRRNSPMFALTRVVFRAEALSRLRGCVIGCMITTRPEARRIQ